MAAVTRTLAVLLVVLAAAAAAEYTDTFAICVDGHDESHARQIAEKHGFELLHQIIGDCYLLRHHEVRKRSLSSSPVHHSLLKSEDKVTFVEQQKAKRRVKRDHVEPTLRHRRRTRDGRHQRAPIYRSTYLNDPSWPRMWYLNRGGGLDMNVQGAWSQGVTGRGVVVTILDDGLEKDHPDLMDNYDPMASYDVNGHDPDPQPRYDLNDSNRHGTRCAGEVAGVANNSLCAVGVAFEANIGGVRMLDGEVTDAVEARSLGLNQNHIDIYSASWGPDDDGETVDGPGELAKRAFKEGIVNGRNGKGSIFVWASGNGGRELDNCNCDGYTNSLWTLSISSATENGDVPWYSEACSSTLATTYSSGSSLEKQIVTTDLHRGCTATHTGTSASAPLAAGICALALQVNQDLTWRDMQHIVVRTARRANLRAADWVTNGVGRNVSHSFGYGLMDATAMVNLARTWRPVPEQRKCETPSAHVDKLVPSHSKVVLTLTVNSCEGVNYMEHVQARISLDATRRGDIRIFLTSPAGTTSTLLDKRPHDSSRAGFKEWPFMTTHNWDESPLGTWSLEVHNDGRYTATVSDWTLVMFGTEVEAGTAPPAQPPQPPPTSSTERSAAAPTTALPPRLPGCLRANTSASLCLECEHGRLLSEGSCVTDCPPGRYADRDRAACQPCHYTCAECDGPNDYQCSGCHGDATLTSGPLGARSCLNTELLERARAADRWYGGVLTVIVLLALALLVVGLLFWRQRRERASGYRALPVGYLAAGGGYTDAEPTSNGKPAANFVTVVQPPGAPPPPAAQTQLDLVAEVEDFDSSGEESSLLGSAHS
ncbi:furin-like protease 1 [Amphibalanus amphitrite]|uniref:furin-like protease 1 n=1 Tax=Amphibalanus amphitrite TaxID=1232801 RepID=UPI001C8FE2AC|nr:furin-like protease 1 [Amphibalanus amphitrite]XP_043235225.1 furin-like protease 1 [Amphibalanus amphitrite]XP_043235226.1 furin-like protease 1 [Amphibalanus amphitrite]